MSSTLHLPLSAVLLAVQFLGLEAPDGASVEEATTLLSEGLAEYNLEIDAFMTEEALFSMGYHRGLRGASYSEEHQVPADANGVSKELVLALEEGYALGLEARDVQFPPPPSLVYAARKAGQIKWGQFAAWASGLDLSTTQRLAHAVVVGSGKSAVTIGAGTPVDVLSDGIMKDGVPHIVIGVDGLALILPVPEGDPKLVAGNFAVSVAKTRRTPGRKPREKKDGSSAESAASAPRGPTLKDVIIAVCEGADGGPGPLQSNGAFASRVRALAVERGIADKASAFVQKADKHVPYYLNCYHPTKEGHTGRLGVAEPLAWVCEAIAARKTFLRFDGSWEQRIAQCGPNLAAALQDRVARLKTTPAPAEEAAQAQPEEAAQAQPEEAAQAQPEEAAQAQAQAQPEEAAPAPVKKNKRGKDQATA